MVGTNIFSIIRNLYVFRTQNEYLIKVLLNFKFTELIFESSFFFTLFLADVILFFGLDMTGFLLIEILYNKTNKILGLISNLIFKFL